jgi:hypothetical protein
MDSQQMPSTDDQSLPSRRLPWETPTFMVFQCSVRTNGPSPATAHTDAVGGAPCSS